LVAGCEGGVAGIEAGIALVEADIMLVAAVFEPEVGGVFAREGV